MTIFRFLIGTVLAAGIGIASFAFFARTDSPLKESLAPVSASLPDGVREPPAPAAPRGQDSGPAASPPPTQQENKNTVRKTAVSASAPQPCMGSPFDQLRCWRGYYGALVESQGVQAAMADLRSRYNDSFVRAQCHQLAHIIGRAGADAYPSVSEAFANGDAFCWSGYYHGVMEGVSSAIGKEKLPQALNAVCQDIPGKEKYSFDYYNCVHGLGHGIMSLLNSEVPASLALCDNLSGGWERSSCWSGVFMENVIADEVYHASKYLSDNPLYPCTAVADTYRATCYLMQTSRMLALVNNDFSRVFDLCATVGEPYVNICYQSLGRDASGRSSSNVNQTKITCLLGRDERQRSNCVIGAVKDFISYFHSDVQAKELCAALPETLQSTCSATAASYYEVF